MIAFERLTVWRRAHALVLRLCAATHGFPQDERFGLTSQLRRSAAAVAANIAEGARAAHPGEFARSLDIAQREASEASYHLLLARDLRYLPDALADELIEEASVIGRMLHALRRRVIAQPRDPRKTPPTS